jgi:hypothetical protein
LRRALRRLAILGASIAAGALTYWFVKLGGYLGSLTHVVTPFYWTMNEIGAWIFGIVMTFYAGVSFASEDDL